MHKGQDLDPWQELNTFKLTHESLTIIDDAILLLSVKNIKS